MRRWLLACFLASASLVALPGRAQKVDDATRNAARALGEEGLALAEQGDHRAAVERFDRALELMRVPTLALLSGKSLEKLGRLVEASERYRAAAGMQVDPDLPRAFRDGQIAAQKEARAAESALKPRIPKLTIAIRGAEPSTVQVSVDGKRMQRALVGVPIPIDPGVHLVQGARHKDIVTKTVTLADGAKSEIELEFPARAGAATAPESTGAPGAQPGDRDRPVWPTLGWVALGVGVAGVAVGAGFYASASADSNDLDTQCENGRCPETVSDDLDAYNTKKTLSTVGFIVGGVGIAAGATILIAAPRSGSKTTAGVAPFIGLGSAGLCGAF